MNVKINKQNFQFSIFNFQSLLIWLLVIGLLVYTRFINLGWGLPYPMHPDERNMANAVQQLNCEIQNSKVSLARASKIQNCFNPHFFAYGQLPLYLGYLVMLVTKLSSTLSLRLISAVASVLTFAVILKIIQLFKKRLGRVEKLAVALVLIFSPYAIQFSHFGTTESLLMMFYSLIVYLSIKVLDSNPCLRRQVYWNDIFLLSLFSGMAIATKISAIVFIGIPALVLLQGQSLKGSVLKRTVPFLVLLLITFIFAIIFSPHNLFNWQDFLGSMKYESDVALGKIVVFYTRQFVGTLPVWFQLTKVFPYALGFFLGGLGGLGFLGLGWRERKINLLRLAFLVYFLPNAFLFAKWTRFMAPVFPIITIFSILFILRLKNKIIFYGLVLMMIIPGISYLSVYLKPDTRLAASNWIYKNIPGNSYILSETANVVDIPVGGDKNYQVISFNFYDLDENLQLQEELKSYLEKADYIFIPSRRIFANHSKEKYPLLNKYYEDLFNGKLGFEKVAEFSAGLNDEQAEETWTVFDHPVIRIYKKISNLKS